MEELLVSVDVEAAGSVPALYPLLSIGACLVDDIDDRFYAELKPVGERVESAAVEVGWPERPAAETIALLEREGESVENASTVNRSWLYGSATNLLRRRSSRQARLSGLPLQLDRPDVAGVRADETSDVAVLD